MLRTDPTLAHADVFTAAVVGDDLHLAELLRHDPAAAVASGGPRVWQPLSYLCFSRFLKEERGRARDFVRAAERLLQHGADPNSAWINPEDGVSEVALYGAAGIANSLELTRVLLDAGADVNDGETLYHAAEFSTESGHAVLRLLFARQPRREWLSYCMAHKLDYEDVPGLRLFIEAGADVNFRGDRGALAGWTPLHFGIFRRRSAAVIQTLIGAGADVHRPGREGVPPLALARRLGHVEAARLLEAAGAAQAMTPKEAFLAACTAGNSRRARALLKKSPALLQQLRPDDQKLLTVVAAAGNLRAVRLMLDLGFDLEAKGDWGGTALHQAAWHGHVDVVAFLLKQGANTAALNRWGGDVLHTALHAATHGEHVHGVEMILLLAQHVGPAGITEQHRAAARDAGGLLAALEAVCIGAAAELPRPGTASSP